MNSYNSALTAYAQSAGEINSNLAGYRSDVDRVRGLNKQLAEAAETKIDLDALKGIGEEAAVRAFKTYGGKALAYVDNKLLGGRIQSDTEGLQRKLEGKARSLYQSARERMSGGGVESGEGEDGVELQDIEGSGDIDTGSIRVGRMQGISEDTTGGVDVEGNLGDEALVEEPEETVGSFEDFMSQFDTPMTDTGDIDFERSSNQLQMGLEDRSSRQMREEGNREAGEREDMGSEDQDVGREPSTEGGEEGGADEPLEGTMEDGVEDLGDTATGALEDATSGISDGLSALSGAAEEGVSSAVAGGLEAAGAGLDATGVGAVIGVPLQIAGAVLEGGALVEAAKSVWDWFDDDILGNKPKLPTVAIPKPQPTLAQRGLLITPNMDTLDMQPSYGGF